MKCQSIICREVFPKKEIPEILLTRLYSISTFLCAWKPERSERTGEISDKVICWMLGIVDKKHNIDING